MYSTVKDWRNKYNMLNPSQYPVENYYTDVKRKRELEHTFGEELLNNIHLLPDPLKKNLADSIITHEEPKQKKNLLNIETVEDRFPEPARQGSPIMAPFAGISNFFSGVMSVITGAMFQRRPQAAPEYFDCYDGSNVSRQGSPASWHSSNVGDQNKNEPTIPISNVQTELKSDMNKDCRSAAAQCEDKLNKVRLLLSSKPVEAPKLRTRRPRRAFIEPGSVEENFEDAFTSENFESVSNDTYIEYYTPYQYQQQELLQTDSPKMRIIAPVNKTTEIVKTLPVLETVNTNCTAVKSDILDCKCEVNCINVDNSSSKEEKSNVKVDGNVETQSETVEKQLKTEKIDASNTTNKNDNVPLVENTKEVLVSSCEDKLMKLKALLQERRKKNAKTNITSTDSAPESVEKTNEKAHKTKNVTIDKSQDKRFKNPCRKTDKRQKSRMRKHIHDDIIFAHEINSEDLSSAENSPSINSLEDRLSGKVCGKVRKSKIPKESPVSSPKLPETPPSLPKLDCFDEISGKFLSTSATDSEDSFQIVFNDSPKTQRRLPSDCDSEDSFIVFEDSPDSCYTSNDVFGEESDEESDYSDSDSDISDSGCVPIAKMAHNLSRTISDLTDDSLYEETCDEVDCAVRSVCEEIPSEDILDDSEEVCEEKDTGLLLTEAKKIQRKDLPPKRVQFSTQPPKVHVMRVWAFAARQARIGNWDRCALDRDRFKRRIADVDMAVSWVLKPQHRSRVMFQRFMPWWNQLKRKEIAEKKLKKEEEDRRLAEEKEIEEIRLAEEKELEERRQAEEKEVEEARLKAEAESKQNEGNISKVIPDGVNGVNGNIDATKSLKAHDTASKHSKKQLEHDKINKKLSKFVERCIKTAAIEQRLVAAENGLNKLETDNILTEDTDCKVTTKVNKINDDNAVIKNCKVTSVDVKNEFNQKSLCNNDVKVINGVTNIKLGLTDDALSGT